MTDTLIAAATTSDGAQQGDATQAAAGAAPLDQQQAAGTLPGQEQAGSEADEPVGAPESYEDFTTPEGVAAMDGDVLAEFKEVAKELNLSQKQAQAFLDRMMPMGQKRTEAMMQQARADWETQSRADAEFGGVKLESSLAAAAKARDSFGTPELRQLLNESGLGNHPEVIRLFVRVGKAISEDKVVVGGSGVQAPKTGPVSEADRAAILYPNMK